MKRPKAKVEFAHGFAIACAELVRLYDQPTMAADIIAGSGFQLRDFAGVDEYDLKVIRKLFREERTSKDTRKKVRGRELRGRSEG